MSGTAAAPTAGTATDSAGLLDQVVAATRQTAPDRAQDLVKALVEQALAGTVTFEKNLGFSVDEAIRRIDRQVSDQLNAIMHHEKFRKLEGAWRGLKYLVHNSETGGSLRIRMLNLSKPEL